MQYVLKLYFLSELEIGTGVTSKLDVISLWLVGGKCSQQAELSGENINITYKPDGTHIAVGNRVNSFSFVANSRNIHYLLWSVLDAFCNPAILVIVS